MEKIVFSKSLEKTESKNWRIVRTNPEDEITMLKQQEGSYMFVGGISLATYLIERGLVDEYILHVMPIVVGGGRRLFEGINLPEKLNLKLLETKVFKSGSVLHRYTK
jgi:dihydrofolate reductase